MFLKLMWCNWSKHYFWVPARGKNRTTDRPELKAWQFSADQHIILPFSLMISLVVCVYWSFPFSSLQLLPICFLVTEKKIDSVWVIFPEVLCAFNVYVYIHIKNTLHFLHERNDLKIQKTSTDGITVIRSNGTC